MRLYYPPALAALVFGGCVAACSSFLHFSDPTLQSVSCVVTDIILAPLEAIAVELGLPLDLVKLLYGEACNVAAEQGLSQHDAEQYGLKHAELQARAMKAMGLRITEPTEGGAP